MDGLLAAMGNFQIRLLAKGYTEPLKIKQGYKIVIQGISAFVWDSFNFAGEYDLGYWSCNDLRFSRIQLNGYINLHNSDFNKFREKFGKGNDFMILTHLYPVDIDAEFSYEADL